MKLNDMLAATSTVVVEFAGEQVPVTYFPNAVTMELVDALDALADEAEKARAAGEKTDHDYITAQLCKIVESWDVLDDQEQRIPPTVENMRRMPVSFLNAVMEAVNRDAKVDEGESEGSVGG